MLCRTVQSVLGLCIGAHVAVAHCAIAQPENYTYLGRHTDQAESLSIDVHLMAGDDIQWFVIELPAVRIDDGFVDYGTYLHGEWWTENELHSPELGLYDASGRVVAQAFLYGPDNSVHASFGMADPRPRSNHNGEEAEGEQPLAGQMGPLTGGVYWLAVLNGFGGFGPTNWNAQCFTPRDFRERDTVVRIRIQPPGVPYCDPDFNWDGNADQDDVWYLANVIAGGENVTGRFPDYNRDGSEDMDDIAALINTIAGGGCP